MLGKCFGIEGGDLNIHWGIESDYKSTGAVITGASTLRNVSSLTSREPDPTHLRHWSRQNRSIHPQGWKSYRRLRSQDQERYQCLK